MIDKEENIASLREQINKILLTVDVFNRLPEIRTKTYLQNHLLDMLGTLGYGTHEYVEEAIENIKLPTEELEVLNQLTFDDGEELLSAFTLAVAHLIALHKKQRLPINWDMLLNY